METFKMIIRNKPHPTKITIAGKEYCVITFECTHPQLTMPGKRKEFVKLKFTVFSLAAWTLFRANNLYVGKYLYIKGNKAPEYGPTAFWASDLEEITGMPTKQDELLDFEQYEF
jgi:hypothetical protein